MRAGEEPRRRSESAGLCDRRGPRRRKASLQEGLSRGQPGGQGSGQKLGQPQRLSMTPDQTAGNLNTNDFAKTYGSTDIKAKVLNNAHIIHVFCY